MARKLFGGVTAQEFFDEKLAGGSLTDAMRATGLAMNTVRAIAYETNADARTVGPVRQLADWSRTVGAARERGVWISASLTLHLDD